MGNSQAQDEININPNMIQEEQSKQKVLKIDPYKKIKSSLSQIQNFSLTEIRKIYNDFRNISLFPFIDITYFSHIMPFNRISSFFIFNEFTSKIQYMNFYEFLCCLVLTSYSNFEQKVKFIYMIFDLDQSNSLDHKEMIVICFCFITGYCRMTDCDIPTNNQMENFAKLVFQKTFVKVESQLSFKEVKEWVESNQTAVNLFQRFEQDYKMQDSIFVFKPIKFYNYTESQYVFKLIGAALKNTSFYKEIKLVMHSINQKKNKFYIPQQFTKNKKTETKDKNNELELEDVITKIIQSKQKAKVKSPDSKLPSIGNNYSVLDLKKKNEEKKMIVVDGFCLSKKEVYHLKRYFDKLADHENKINIKTFADKPHMKGVLPSLFNFLDQKQQGKVDFNQFLQVMYPSITRDQIKVINKWVDYYLKTLQSNTDIQNQSQIQDKNIKYLPVNCIIRMREIFSLFDQGNKGYITHDDMKQQLKLGFSNQYIEDLFKDDNGNYKEKIKLNSFIKIIIPTNYELHPQDYEQMRKEDYD